MTLELITRKSECGDAGVYPFVDPLTSISLYNTQLAEIRKSETGRRLLDFIENRPERVAVVFIRNPGPKDGPDPISTDSTYIPPWRAFGDFDRGFADQLPALTGGMVLVNVDTPVTVSTNGPELPSWVSLAHELGHAAQYFEDSHGFINRFQIRIMDLTDKIPRGSRNRFRNPHMVGTSRLVELWIENDNVARWEAPICSESGLPSRINYEKSEDRYGPNDVEQV